MRKIKLEVEEKLTYRREIIVQVPDDMPESEIERVLAKAEREEFISDFMYVLDANCMENPEGYDDDMSSPFYSEVECLEYEFIDDGDESE